MTAVVSLAAPRDRLLGLPRSGKLVTGLAIVGFFALLAVIGPMLAGDPEALVAGRLDPPSAQLWLGSTDTGQSVLAQLLHATRGSMLIGLVAGVLATAASLVVGVVGGYVGGWLDEAFSLLSNVTLVIPTLPLLIVVADYVEDSGPVTYALIISVISWAGPSRVIRSQVLSLRNRDYVDAARVSGEPGWRIMIFHILPNLTPVIASGFVWAVIGAILTESGLSALGLGGGSVTSWGGMLYFAQNGSALSLGAWWWFVPPGLCIAVLGTGLSLINFSIDELMNPRLRKAAA
ncbi:ABC transporter permease [Nonomuraea guangzhouensis]|uniref:ABC transporter permease n=1 Tax=Nonomuraea guangzhouensis TaxID=1291555 RepID=A0ABW4G7L7_9ACTN|nr:ABC transporter permease [Nonomuraea guangzhouensis]